MSFLEALGIVWNGIWWFLNSFFNSNFFQGFSTILTVLGAILIYLDQKAKEKKQIATLLVNEIRNAEEAVQQLKSRNKADEIPEIIILPQNNWSKYSHLFSKDFDQDQMNSINKFYFDVERANYIVSYGNTVDIFLMNARDRSKSIHKSLLRLIEKTPAGNLEQAISEFKSKIESRASIYRYAPDGFNTTLDKHLQDIVPILGTPIGLKLKKLADLRE